MVKCPYLDLFFKKIIIRIMKQKLLNKNLYMLKGSYLKNGYDWWWHSFTGINEKTKEERQFFIEYFIINPSISPFKISLGKDNKPSYLMVKCGSWGKNKLEINKLYPINEIDIKKKVLSISHPDFLLTEDRIKGNIKVDDSINYDYLSDKGSMVWDLKLEKVITYDVGYGTSPLFRNLKAFDMYWHAQGMKTLMEGYVIFNNEKYIVDKETSYGYSDKNWGKDFTSPWIWLSSSDLVSELTNKRLFNSAFEIGGGRPRAFGITFNNKLLIDMVYENKKYEFNFSKFWTFTKTKFDCYETDTKIIWNITTKNIKREKLEVHIECNKEDMLFVRYEAPDGIMKFKRLFNGGNAKGTIILSKNNKIIDKMHSEHIGCEYGKYQSEGDNYYKL